MLQTEFVLQKNKIIIKMAQVFKGLIYILLVLHFQFGCSYMIPEKSIEPNIIEDMWNSMSLESYHQFETQPSTDLIVEDYASYELGRQEETLFNRLRDYIYDGEWENGFENFDEKQFGYLSYNQKADPIQFIIYNTSLIRLSMLDSYYVDQYTASLFIYYDEAEDFNNSTATFDIVDGLVHVYIEDNFKLVNQEYCTANTNIQFLNSTNNEPWDGSMTNYKNVVVKLSMMSSNCSIDYYSSDMQIDDFSQAMEQALNYALCSIVIIIVEIVMLRSLIQHLLDNPFEQNKHSIIALSWTSALDTCYIIMHCYLGLVYRLSFEIFQTFIIIALFYLVLVMIFEFQFLVMVWKFRHDNEFNNHSQLQKAYLMFNLKYYAGLLIVNLFVILFLFDDWIYFILFSYMIPLIVHNARVGIQHCFSYKIVFGVFLPKIFPVLYMRACPHNLFRLSPREDFIITFLCWFAVLIIINLIQGRFGPRFFIPSCFLPPKYKYKKKISEVFQSDPISECTICYGMLNEKSDSPVPDPPANSNKVSDSQSLEENPLTTSLKAPEETFVFVTPCKHKFHEDCLKKWMEIKLECPFCRGKLPPLQQQINFIKKVKSSAIFQYINLLNKKFFGLICF